MIIGLGHKARVGKDTVAKMMARHWGFYDIAFAAPLKAAAQKVFGFDHDQVDGPHKETVDQYWGLTPREVLQRFGTDAMRREFGPDIWIKALQRFIQMRSVDGVGGLWVVTDVRFRNEAEAIKSWGGEVWRIDRPGVCASGGVDGHPSEHDLDGWDGWDQVINNSGSLYDTYAQLARLLGRPRS